MQQWIKLLTQDAAKQLGMLQQPAAEISSTASVSQCQSLRISTWHTAETLSTAILKVLVWAMRLRS